MNERRALLDRPFGTGFFVTLGGLVAVAIGVAVSNLSTVLIAIAFALFAALGLNPVVRNLQRLGVTRGWAITIVYAGLAIVLAGVLVVVLPTAVSQIAQFVRSVPHLVADFQKTSAYTWLVATFGVDVNTLVSDVQSYLTRADTITTIGKGALQIGGTVAASVSGTIVALVLSLYFLAALPAMKAALARLFPARVRAKVVELTDDIADSVGGYVVGMVVLAFCNAVVALVLHLALQLKYPMLMAVVAFLLTLIPLVGSVLYWIVASSLALFSGWVPALLFAAIYLVYMQLEAYVLTPKVMNRAISVPGALVVIGALIGGTILGLLGALVAVPVTASLLIIAKQVLLPRQDAKT
ncbi:AI-2E family transporter [Microbacterium aoyamense]|uniref:AI-2E family transporter n=1 Tax=Microbacterium aoyamense TaxID=344166 RepID=A0ABN2PGP1_9MICO|nr:AI-2E family transporter [Microbacterium aoyamense]